MIWIDSDATPTDANVRSLQGPNRGDVSLRLAVENVDHTSIRPSHRNKNFVVDGIGVQLIGVDQSGLETLNDSGRRFLAGGAAAESHDRVGKGVRHDDFIVDGVIHDRVHAARQHGLLPFNSPNGFGVSVRQPGEHRNLRMGHSVRGQNLLSLRIVTDSSVG